MMLHTEKTASLLESIGRGPDDKVFTQLYGQDALATAEALDQGAHAEAALRGWAVSVKDMFDVKGHVTLAGCPLLGRSMPARQDADAVALLRAAGAILLGKTSMSELAYSGLGLNPHFGAPRNTFDPRRVPGGSSSGAAVSVALGLSDASIGSDTGGSVRIPAAFNGIVGYKPTQSRISRRGMVPLSPSQDTVGILAKNIARCAAVDSVLARDPGTLEAMALAGMRIAVAATPFCDNLDDSVAAAFERSLACLQKAGARFVDTDFSAGDVIASMNRLGGLVGPEAFEAHGHLLTHAEALDPFVASQLRTFANHPRTDYLRALELRRQAQSVFAREALDFDLLLCPTVAVAAPALDPLDDPDRLFAANRAVLRNTNMFNTLDVPALSMPCHAGQEPPVGLMLVGRHGKDRELLCIAASIELLLS